VSAVAAQQLARARERFRAGRQPEAESILRSLVDGPGAPVESLELLGACLGAQGRHGEALECIDRAMRAREPTAAGLHNRAQALLALGRVPEARTDLDKALALDPRSVPAWTALGRALESLGEVPGAEQAYRQAARLGPGSAAPFYNLGRFLYDAGRPEEAIAGYRKALALDPSLAAARNNLAIALRESGRIDEAIALLEQVAAGPGAPPEILNSLGVAYYARGRFALAEACYRRALAAAPAMDEAEINLGNALSAQGREADAIACYRRVIERSPGNADALSNLGIALQEQEQPAAAIEAYRRALEARPDHPDAFNNLGFLLDQQGRRADAMALYAQALAANPRFARAAYNLALAKLASFEFAEGWALADPSRFQIVPPVATPRPFKVARLTPADWDRVRRLAVWREQGVGDQILYATTLPELEARNVPFVLETDARLVAAFRRAHPHWEVVPPAASEAAFHDCDRHIPLGSLPALVRDTRESFQRQPRALLAADPGRAADMRARLAADGAFVVGISWRSFQPKLRGYVERRKSAPLAAYAALAASRPAVRLLDQQYGDPVAEREGFARAGGALARLAELDLFNDLDGVLAAIAACDAVVTTSNVTAHLAGSIGKRTLLMYPAGVPPFHYWATDETGRCLWYPSVTIVTGPALRTWEGLLARAAELLDRRAD
jgi:tetratricopeptide (TPR) repeat protein